jgi:hypothetical protein
VRQQKVKASPRNVGAQDASAKKESSPVLVPEPGQSVVQVPSVQELFLDAILPQNKDDIVRLRDTVLMNLFIAAENGSLPPRTQVSLLRLLLEYENQVRAIARPAMNLTVHDERKVDMTVLVNKLEGLPTDALAALSKGGKVDVIDHDSS